MAVKVVRAGRCATLSFRRRLQREIRLLAALDQTNVVRVYDAGEWSGLPCYAMERGSRSRTSYAPGPWPGCRRPPTGARGTAFWPAYQAWSLDVVKGCADATMG